MQGVSKQLARTAVRQYYIPNHSLTRPQSKCTNTSQNLQPKMVSESLKFQRVQDQLQRHDEKPIYLKDGGPSRNLYLTTLGLCGLGILSKISYERKEPMLCN